MRIRYDIHIRIKIALDWLFRKPKGWSRRAFFPVLSCVSVSVSVNESNRNPKQGGGGGGPPRCWPRGPRRADRARPLSGSSPLTRPVCVCDGDVVSGGFFGADEAAVLPPTWGPGSSMTVVSSDRALLGWGAAQR